MTSTEEKTVKKRKVTVTVDGQSCSFYSDDPDVYISALEQRANEVIRQTERFSGASSRTNAVLSVIYLTDALMRSEKENKTKSGNENRRPGKNNPQPPAEDQGQVSVWELLDDRH